MVGYSHTHMYLLDHSKENFKYCLPLRLSIGPVFIELYAVYVPETTVTNGLHQIQVCSPLEKGYMYM